MAAPTDRSHPVSIEAVIFDVGETPVDVGAAALIDPLVELPSVLRMPADPP